MPLPSNVETIVVGAGQAGLAMSHFLSEGGRDHVVLERRVTLGGGWQDRWDDFRLVTPNWCTSLPGQPYDGAEPDGFMPRDEIVDRIARYADTLGAPVLIETSVSRLATRETGGFRVETNQGVITADRVVVATGGYHAPRVPPIAAGLPTRVVHLHSHEYRNERALPEGAVLIVGTGQSGVQIAEELGAAGRRVFLSVGSAPRVPRRYRGRDIFHWLAALATRGPAFGVGLPTVETLPDPRMRTAGNPHLSGQGGGRETNLREMATRGFTLVGRIDSVDGERIRPAPGLGATLARIDAFFGERFQPQIDRFIELAGIDAPADDRVPFDFEPPDIVELDLADAGISTVIWTTGYRLDFAWIDLPIFDEPCFPRHRRGIS
jgi:putative flavoprotein involved in K+ transport